MFKGRAVLVIDKTESKWVPWDVHTMIQKINMDDLGGEVAEAFDCAAADCLPMPSAAYNMKEGDRIRVLVHFELHFHKDYWGEVSTELYYMREYVLRRQPYKRRKKYRK